MVDTLSIGSAVLDVLLKSKSFTPTSVSGELMLCEIYGGKANVDDALIVSGGAGTNTAVSFARQGFTAGVVAEIGKDVAAQIIWDDLTRENVSTEYVITERQERTGMSAILIAEDGSRSAMTYRGAAHMLTPKDIPWDVVKGSRHVHLSSVGNADLIRELFLFCESNTVSLSWNPSKNELEEILFQSGRVFKDACKIICINDQEFAVAKEKESVLYEMSEIVVITKGKDGGDIWERGKKHVYESKHVQVIDETGAGDAFVSGFVGEYLRSKDSQKAVAFAIANATSVVQSMGAKRGLLAANGSDHISR